MTGEILTDGSRLQTLQTAAKTLILPTMHGFNTWAGSMKLKKSLRMSWACSCIRFGLRFKRERLLIKNLHGFLRRPGGCQRQGMGGFFIE